MHGLECGVNILDFRCRGGAARKMRAVEMPGDGNCCSDAIVRAGVGIYPMAWSDIRMK